MDNTYKYFVSAAFITLLIVACNTKNPQTSTQNATASANNTANSPRVDTLPKLNVAGPALLKKGMNVIRYDNGAVKMQGNTKDGKRTGEWKSFFQNGQLQSDEFFTDGKPDGKVVVYYENGKKMYEGENDNGILKGVWKYWNEKGELTRTVDYTKQPLKHR